jgi:hypothetical protein
MCQRILCEGDRIRKKNKPAGDPYYPDKGDNLKIWEFGNLEMDTITILF